MEQRNQQPEIENLTHQEAIEKMQELVKHNAICMFTTNVKEAPLHTRPMGTQQVDDQGIFWFLSAEDSDKNAEITEDNEVQLFYANTSNSEYMSVYGHASISRDQNEIDQIWSPIAKAWFKEGKEDPRITVIKVTPEEAYYWDTKHSKMVSMVKILASMVSGKTMDDGVEGKMTL